MANFGGMTETENRVRLDKWLWAARFFKTRSLAADAIAGGKVQVNGDRVKRAKPVQVGDEVRIRQGPYEHQIVVRENPIAAARWLCREADEENPESRAAVKQWRSSEELHAAFVRTRGGRGKRIWREIEKLKRRER